MGQHFFVDGMQDERHWKTQVYEQGPEFNDELAAKEEQLGAQKGEAGQWASCIRVVDALTLSTTRSIA